MSDMGVIAKWRYPVIVLKPRKFSQADVLPPLWETGDMKKPELTDVVWLGPKEEMDHASHRVGKCSECLEIICAREGGN